MGSHFMFSRMGKSQEAERRFANYLEAYGDGSSEQERESIRNQLWKEFGVEGAVFVLDMSGFSRLSEKHGLVLYLSRIRRMQLLVEPLVLKHDGRLVKFLADNAFAFFPSVERATEAAIQVNRRLHAENECSREEFDIEVACGIDYGNFFLVGNRDFFGATVNRACKLGEDLGKAGQILLTDTAMAQLPADQFQSEPFQVEMSGVTLNVHDLKFS